MSTPSPKRENLLLNLACNIALPTLVLTKFSGEDRLGPMWGMVVALAFPFGYGVVDVIRRRKTNFFSIVGILSVLLTGGLNQLKADVFWFAVKEAAVPTLFGIAVVWSGRTKRPLVRELLWNEQVIDTARVDAVLTERNQHAAFERLLAQATNGLAVSFLLSAVLNYGLARYLLKSPPGTEAFNAELGRMNLLSWPVIVLPYMVVTMFVLWRLLNGFTQLTGLQLEEVFHGAKKEPAAADTPAKN
ncbi:MAG: VC0807 family protein [Opitutaceae bacterium]